MSLEIETTRPLVESRPLADAAIASVLIGVQGAVIGLQKDVAELRKELDDIKQRIRKVC